QPNTKTTNNFNNSQTNSSPIQQLSSSSGREKDAKIRDEFRAADKMNSNPSSLQQHSGAIYTSRHLSQHLDLEDIPEPKNSIELTAATPDSEYFILSDEESPNE
ncbi:13850_t:CDS:2, partial [Gigaspora rosea]